MRTPEELRKLWENHEDWQLESIVSGKIPGCLEYEIAKDVLKKRRFALEEKREQDRKNASRHHWYQKPVGIVALSVVGGLILLCIAAILRVHYPEFFK